MCQIWLRSDGRVEKKWGTDRQTDKGTLQLYIVDCKYTRSYGHFDDFMKSQRPYWIYFLEIEKGPGPPSTSG